MIVVQRYDADERPVEHHGWRLFVPVLPWRHRRYDITTDDFVTGWWVWSVCLEAFRLGYGRENSAVGVTIGVTWGWSLTDYKTPSRINRMRLHGATQTK